MTFQPVLPLSGIAGWALLKRTLPAQQAAFAQSPSLRRDEAAFRDRIGQITTADALIADRQVLSVALGAYGLDGDIANKAFLRKVLDEGTLAADALANRLADKAYRSFSATFGFGDFAVPRTVLSDFPDKVLERYRTLRFEAAVGQQNEDFRLALNAERELADLAGRGLGDDAAWFTIMGSPPLRKVFEVALGLPSRFGTLDIDRQLQVFRDKAADRLGITGISDFADRGVTDRLITRFLGQAALAAGPSASTPGAAALQILSGRSA
ncbi:DUF1217 domain-containing protein [Aliigemmobacter aestuarii]|uniref:DUF1217 domain-containing protein n=1 Tax=Aliigemmobacter aestuarii TaxID=1445661 RepID=A0A4S3MTM9_9RHOB|nr:DUF1217 domain-containing protein [Gemmobacter aestuarii]THD85534.1 DUF1217 domain-containing protein [Gemmobacter aestuarii]